MLNQCLFVKIIIIIRMSPVLVPPGAWAPPLWHGTEVWLLLNCYVSENCT
jgi:hypothetical protein